MKRRRIWIIAAMVCVAAMLVAVLWPLEKEPKYKGKRLSEWVFHGVQSLRNEHEMAVAIRAMDTNSLPFFVKWISYTPSPRKTAWLATIAKVPAWLGGPRLLRAVDGDWEVRANGARFGLTLLGESAAPAAPELSVLLGHADPAVRLRAIQALAGMGKPGVRGLAEAADDARNSQRRDIVYMLIKVCRAEADTNFSIPVIQRYLNDPDPTVVITAISGLTPVDYQPGFNKDFTVPAFIQLSRHSNSVVRSSAVAGLGKYKLDAGHSMDALIERLTDTDIGVRKSATNALISMKVLSDPKMEMRRAVTETLKWVGPEVLKTNQ